MTRKKGQIVKHNPGAGQWYIQPEGGGELVSFPKRRAYERKGDQEVKVSKPPEVGDVVEFEVSETDATRASRVVIIRRGRRRQPTQQVYRTGSLPLPGEVSGTLLQSLNAKIVNPSLLLDKLIVWEREWDFAEKEKNDFLQRSLLKNYSSYLRYSDSFYPQWLVRWKALLAEAEAHQLVMRTDWRLAVDLGRQSVLENCGIALHRVYGFPVIPGQAVKGLAHAYYESVLWPGKREVDDQLGFLKQVQQIFGSIASPSIVEFVKSQQRCDKATRQALLARTAGDVIFFDAIPSKLPQLEIDIVNCHYPQWYRNEAPPTDDQDPVPVYFLTVAPGAEFLFAVAPRSRRGNGSRGDVPSLMRDVAENLRAALQTLGAGAKTSAGYGYFLPA